MEQDIFASPFIDIDEWREMPVRHRYVHGGFEGTQTRFSFYFPPKERYQGRFFQYITPFPDNENLSQGAAGEEDKISFSIESGAYFIETNGGGRADLTQHGFQNDPAIGAFRANAACAMYSRKVAREMYDCDRPYGYSFGGSGGAYRTIGGVENTTEVWDGAVPYVMGSPMAIPNVFCVRMHAMRILKDKFPQIIDALEPGGSGDMYAGLNQEEKEALKEVTRMGFPPKSWFGYETMGIHGFLVLYQGVVMADNTYFTQDFWHTAGYYGANPPASLLKARIQQKSRIKAGIPFDQAVEMGLAEPVSAHERGTADLAWKSAGGEGSMPAAYQLQDSMPDVDFLGGDLVIKSGAATGASLQITAVIGDTVVLSPTNPLELLLKILPGDEVQVDNSNFLAVQTYHRHQDPGEQYPVWDQFRDEEGNPIYPQRPMLLGPLFTANAAGTVPTGKFKGKMILLGSLLDREAYPWQCDWYRKRVKEHLGKKTDDHFRLWYTENALHGDLTEQEDQTHAISYLGVLQQALRDLSAWVEEGISPPSTTNYVIKDGQVVIPPTANDRKGIQPVVHLTANGGKRADVTTDELVEFAVEIEVPKGIGSIVSVAWDFEGIGDFLVKENLDEASTCLSKLTLKATHTYTESGTYFAVVRVASQREGNRETVFTRIHNLDRVRVFVGLNE